MSRFIIRRLAMMLLVLFLISWRGCVDRGRVRIGQVGYAMTLMGLTRGPNSRFEGNALFDGTDLVAAPDAQLRKIRGAASPWSFRTR